MGTAYSYGGSIQLQVIAKEKSSGDQAGVRTGASIIDMILGGRDGPPPTINGYLKGIIKVPVAGATLLLADVNSGPNATPWPLQGYGVDNDSGFPLGFRPGANTKLKGLLVRNVDPNGRNVRFDSANLPTEFRFSVHLAPGEFVYRIQKNPSADDILVTGTNDDMNLSPVVAPDDVGAPGGDSRSLRRLAEAMGTAFTYAGDLMLRVAPKETAKGDENGVRFAVSTVDLTFGSGSLSPTLTGYLRGIAKTPANGNGISLLLAHATDPFQGVGVNADGSPGAPGYPKGFVPGGSTKIKGIFVRNVDTTDLKSVNVNFTGLPMELASLGTHTLAPGDFVYKLLVHGSEVLTTGTNDALAIVRTTDGSPLVEVHVLYGE